MKNGRKEIRKKRIKVVECRNMTEERKKSKAMK
jgi:hypothetical protein